MTYQSVVPGNREASTSWPIHEVGRNADQFPESAGRLLAANSQLDLSASHIHANGHETTAHAMTWAWYLLAKHPEVVTKMRAEIASVPAAKKSSVRP